MPENGADLKSLLNDPGLLETRAYTAGGWSEGTGGVFGFAASCDPDTAVGTGVGRSGRAGGAADGLDGADLGPLIEPAPVEKVAEHIGDVFAKGGTLLTGGGPQNMKVAREEAFSPTARLFRFQDIDDVMAMANDTIFGLAPDFTAGDLSRVTRVAEALEYGIEDYLEIRYFWMSV